MEHVISDLKVPKLYIPFSKFPVAQQTLSLLELIKQFIYLLFPIFITCNWLKFSQPFPNLIWLLDLFKVFDEVSNVPDSTVSEFDLI